MFYITVFQGKDALVPCISLEGLVNEDHYVVRMRSLFTSCHVGKGIFKASSVTGQAATVIHFLLETPRERLGAQPPARRMHLKQNQRRKIPLLAAHRAKLQRPPRPSEKQRVTPINNTTWAISGSFSRKLWQGLDNGREGEKGLWESGPAYTGVC